MRTAEEDHDGLARVDGFPTVGPGDLPRETATR